MAGSQDMMIIVVMMVMMSSVFSVLAGSGWFFTLPEEGDECEGKDDNGNYVIDEDGKCVLDECDYGYSISSSGKKCIVDEIYDDSDSGGGAGGAGGSGGSGGSGGLPVGRYVRIIQTEATDPNATRDDGTTAGNVDDTNRILNIAEIEVFDKNNTNLSYQKGVTGSSEYPAPHLWVNLTDGNKTNFAHTLGRIETEYDSMTIDLGGETEISKIVITNRTDCCKNRIVRAKIEILDDANNIVSDTVNISAMQDTYTYDFTQTNPTWT
tara:strand:+ start:195 stop:992 length:798 start_codon:yes stop_codon:yes gene_type:complete